MDDNTTMTPESTAAISEIHEHYVTQINNLVAAGREDLVADLADDYDALLRTAHLSRHAA